jgi:hypothetical protein
LNSYTERAGCHAVSARVETRAGDEQIRIRFLDFFQNGRGQILLVLDGVVVAANEGRYDTRAVAQELLQKSAGPHRSLAYLQGRARLLFSANTAEKLV